MTDIVRETFKIMGLGMGAVFTVLMVFFILVKALHAIYPYKE